MMSGKRTNRRPRRTDAEIRSELRALADQLSRIRTQEEGGGVMRRAREGGVQMNEGASQPDHDQCVEAGFEWVARELEFNPSETRAALKHAFVLHHTAGHLACIGSSKSRHRRRMSRTRDAGGDTDDHKNELAHSTCGKTRRVRVDTS